MNDLIKHSDSDKSIERAIKSLSKKELSICNSINEFNQLRSFKLNLSDVLQWKDTIIRLKPEIEPEAISFVVDKLILGELDYDKDLGIQNIINGLNMLVRTEKGYKLNLMTW